jgi:hypothetical protein
MRPADTDHSVAQLERDIRRVRAVLLLLLVVAAGLLLAQILPQARSNAVAVFATAVLLLAGIEIAGNIWRHGQTVPEILRAKKFEVVDDSGHIFVEIGETEDGRGAVVTHDGGEPGVLSPAHPPFTYPHEPRDAAAHDSSGPRRAFERATHDVRGVRVSLSYRGDGVYEAKIIDEKPPDEPAKSASTVLRPRE